MTGRASPVALKPLPAVVEDFDRIAEAIAELAALSSTATRSASRPPMTIGNSLNSFAMSSARRISRCSPASKATGSRPANAACIASSAGSNGGRATPVADFCLRCCTTCWYCASMKLWRTNAMPPSNLRVGGDRDAGADRGDLTVAHDDGAVGDRAARDGSAASRP